MPEWATGEHVDGVGAQTARPVDDAAFLTHTGGWILVQAKSSLSLKDQLHSDLAAALKQLMLVVRGGVPEGAGASAPLRSFDPHRDRVLILTDERAPSTVRKSLVTVVDRLRSLPELVPIDEVASNIGETEALRVLRSLCQQLWLELDGTDLADSDFRQLMRSLAVRSLDLKPSGADFRSLIPDLRDLLESPERLADLWRLLENQALQMSAERQWARRSDLIHHIEAEGIYLTPLARLRPDIRKLQAITAANIASPPSHLAIATPDGPVEVIREVFPIVAGVHGNLAITGEPGVGKSVVLHALATEASSAADVVFLTAVQILNSPGSTRMELNLDHELREVLHGWTSSRPGLLVLDGIDQTRGLDASGWLPHLVDQLRGSRWQITASIRLFDLRHGPRWQQMFRGDSPDPLRTDSSLQQVSHVVVEDLTTAELDRVTARSPALATLLEHAEPRLSQILANPFNLHLVGELLRDDPTTDVATVRTRLDLLHRYWQLRVTSGKEGRLRQRTIDTIVRSMVHDRTQHVNDGVIVDAAQLTTLDGLLSNGVLQDATTSAYAFNRQLTFAHPVLFDFAAAHVALGDVNQADSLADALDDDPDLAMVLRPSLDYRLAIAWHNDQARRTFWRLALRLAAEPHGHILAAAAAAAVAARELRTAAELDELFGACLDAPTALAPAGDARALAHLLAAAIGDAQVPDVGSLAAIGGMCSRLAQEALASDDHDIAYLAAVLGGRAAANHPLPSAAITTWTRAAIDVMEMALKDASDRQPAQLPDVAGGLLAIAAKHDPLATAATVRRAIAEPVLRASGTYTVRRLVDIVCDIAQQAPDLAVDIGASVWLFEEDRNQATQMLSSHILPLTSNRRQDLEGVQYLVGKKFAGLAAIDLVAATDLLVRIVEESPSSFPEFETLPDLPPRVRYGEDLRFIGGHHEVPAMRDALIRQLTASTSKSQLSAAADILYNRLTRSTLWTPILYAAATADTSDLALALRPTITSAALFAHGETWLAAGHLAVRLSPTLDEPSHHALEEAILTATASTDEDEPDRQARLQERRDSLLTALQTDRTVHPQAQQHLTNLTAAGRRAKPLPLLSEEDFEQFRGEWRSESTMEDTPTAGYDLLAAVRSDLARTGQDDQRADARRSLLLAWPELLALPATDFATGDDALLLFRVACQLAFLSDLSPSTDIGNEIFAIITMAIPAVSDGSEVRRTNPNRIASWSPSPATEALIGARALLSRPEWRETHGDQLRDLLLPHLDNPIWLYRLLATDAIDAIFTDVDELLHQAELRLPREDDHHVASRLLNTIGRHLPTRATEVDQLFARLAAETQSAHVIEAAEGEGELYDAPGELVVSYLTVLAARHQTPFAQGQIRAWLSRPIEYAAATTTAATVLRNFLNPADPTAGDNQRRAFELLAPVTELLGSAWRQATAPGAHDEHDRKVVIAKTADHIAQQIYFASGGADQTTGDTERRGNLADFADLALPLLAHLGQIHYPSVTHQLMDTVFHLNSVRPEATLLLAEQLVREDLQYTHESLGLEATLKMIRVCVADHRTFMLDNPSCIAAIRSLLSAYVRVGWPAATRMAERMDELFR